MHQGIQIKVNNSYLPFTPFSRSNTAFFIDCLIILIIIHFCSTRVTTNPGKNFDQYLADILSLIPETSLSSYSENTRHKIAVDKMFYAWNLNVKAVWGSHRQKECDSRHDKLSTVNVSTSWFTMCQKQWECLRKCEEDIKEVLFRSTSDQLFAWRQRRRKKSVSSIFSSCHFEYVC